VWVARIWIRQFVFDDFSGAGLEFADVAGKIGGEPDVAVSIGDESVWARHWRIQVIFRDAACRGINVSQSVRHLTGVPNRPVERRKRIMRARSRRRGGPFFERDASGTRDDCALGPRPFREIFRKIRDQSLELTIRDLGADVLHHMKNCSPVFRAVAGVEHAAELVAASASAL